MFGDRVRITRNNKENPDKRWACNKSIQISNDREIVIRLPSTYLNFQTIVQ